MANEAAVNLKANKQGQLTKSQLEQLGPLFRSVKARRTNSLISAVVVGVLAVFFANSSTFKNLSPYMMIGALAAIGVFVIYTVYRAFAESRDVLQRKVSIVEGVVQRKMGHTRRGRVVHVLEINRVKFFVNDTVYNAFRDGQPYKVYYVKFPPANVLLSVE